MADKLDKKAVWQKFKITEDLFNLAYAVKSFQLQKKYPDWTKEEIHRQTMKLIEKGCA